MSKYSFICTSHCYYAVIAKTLAAHVQWGGLNCEPALYLEQYLVKMISKEHVIIRCENI